MTPTPSPSRSQFVQVIAQLEQFNRSVGWRTRVALLPSAKDVHHHPVFPQPPLDHLPEVDAAHPHLLLPNPATFSCDEIVVGCSSADWLMACTHQEVSHAAAGQADRLAALAAHVVAQRSYFPLFPAPLALPLDASKASALELPCTPDVLVLPSDLAPFAKLLPVARPCVARGGGSGTTAEGNVVCINPGRLTKGTSGVCVCEGGGGAGRRPCSSCSRARVGPLACSGHIRPPPHRAAQGRAGCGSRRASRHQRARATPGGRALPRGDSAPVRAQRAAAAAAAQLSQSLSETPFLFALLARGGGGARVADNAGALPRASHGIPLPRLASAKAVAQRPLRGSRELPGLGGRRGAGLRGWCGAEAGAGGGGERAASGGVGGGLLTAASPWPPRRFQRPSHGASCAWSCCSRRHPKSLWVLGRCWS